MRTLRFPRHLRTRAAIVGAVALMAVAPALFAGGSVSATSAQRTFAISGSITVDTPPALTLPAGSTFTATIDPATGAFTDGQFVIPPFDRGPVSGPQAITTLVQVGAASGSIDPVTGAATITTTFAGTIEVPLLSATCSLGEITMTTTTAAPDGSPFSGSPLTGTTTATGFTVPALVGSDPVLPASIPTAAAIASCSTADAATINATLGLPSSHTFATFTAVETTPVGPVTPGFTG